MKNIFLLIIKLVQWAIAAILVFIAYGGLQGDDFLIPVILLVVAVLITPPVIRLIFVRRKKKTVPGK